MRSAFGVGTAVTVRLSVLCWRYRTTYLNGTHAWMSPFTMYSFNHIRIDDVPKISVKTWFVQKELKDYHVFTEKNLMSLYFFLLRNLLITGKVPEIGITKVIFFLSKYLFKRISETIQWFIFCHFLNMTKSHQFALEFVLTCLLLHNTY